MEPIDFKKKISASVLHKDTWRHFPRPHLTMACSLAVVLTALLAIFPSKNISAARTSVAIELSLPASTIPEEVIAIFDEIEPVQQELEEANWISLEIKSGDNLSLLFHRAGLNASDVHEFVNSNKETKALTKLRPGRQLSFQVGTDNKLQQLRYVVDQLTSTVYRRSDAGFIAEDQNRIPDIRLAYREAQIDNNLTMAAKGVNMTNSTIDELANIFGWDIDFANDIRKGDRFRVLYEEKFLDGKKIGDGNILTAEFVNQGDVLKAVRYVHDDGHAEYYTPEGKSMRREFLQTPLNFRYISSNFNPNRLHPIHKTVRAHRGTDYAADRGTPVWAAGDGKVIASGYTKANGNYVVIQHGEEYQTKYLHLNNRAVKTGQRVRQKQTIGTVGSTGYATGPHLHYEFLKNGVHRNPRTIINSLPKAQSVASNEMERFYLQINPVIAQFSQQQQATQLALIESNSSVN